MVRFHSQLSALLSISLQRTYREISRSAKLQRNAHFQPLHLQGLSLRRLASRHTSGSQTQGSIWRVS